MKKELRPKLEAVKMLLEMAKGADVENLKRKKKKPADKVEVEVDEKDDE